MELRKVLIPNKTLVVLKEGKELNIHSEFIPLVKGKSAIEGKTTPKHVFFETAS